ncbi:unnamed protein product [Linum trigynum]|uniref:Uncharacterized protein n=1 Tax=Linum trigynum TaxID=586398 RepID=A0AAV2CJ35_9ROSI
MIDFRGGIRDVELIDHKVAGNWFTWSNKQQANPIARRIDRVLVNEVSLERFSNSSTSSNPPGVSDHCGIVLDTNPKLNTLPKPFKYFLFWQSNPTYLDIIKQAWQKQVTGYPYYILYGKLQSVKQGLKKLNRDEYSDITGRVKQATIALEVAQMAVLTDPKEEHVKAEKEFCLEYTALKKAEELYYKQKARMRAIKEGGL